MSSEPKAAAGEGAGRPGPERYRPRYRQILDRHLPPAFSGFGAFFDNPHRLATLARLLERVPPPPDARVLNLGSGPFAAEIFVPALRGCAVCAVDYEAAFAPFHGIFRAEGVLDRVSFVRGDVRTVSFRPDSFDLILLHDLLYEPGLDLELLLDHHLPALRAGGLVYLDYMSTRTRRLWRWLGRERHIRYHRYSDRAVAELLSRHGLAVLARTPSFGSPNPVVRTGERVLWTLFRLCNATAIVARREAGSAAA